MASVRVERQDASSGAPSILESAGTRGAATYSCCMSAKTTVGTLEELAKVRRLATDVTRHPLDSGPGLRPLPMNPRRNPVPRRKLQARKTAGLRPVVVVHSGRFCQA